MSARSIRRKNERAAVLQQGKPSSRARRAATGAGAAIAAALFGPAAADAASFEVNKLADTRDGDCSVADCSLREAVLAANVNGEDDLVTFASGLTGQINLDPSFGDIQIRNEGLEIRGPGVDRLTVSGVDESRIFKLFGFNSEGEDVVISGLNMIDGEANGYRPAGGAISSYDRDELNTPCDGGEEVPERRRAEAEAESCVDDGYPANLTVANSAISGSSAARDGGAIAVSYGSAEIAEGAGGLIVRNSVITDNTAGQNYLGGGIWVRENFYGPALIEDSTISANDAGGGGGIAWQGEARRFDSRAAGDTGDDDFLVDSSTVSGNSARFDGGGVLVERGAGAATIQNSTISGNVADAENEDEAIGQGGGIFGEGGEENGTRTVRNTTVAGNSAAEGGGVGVFGAYDASSVIIADNTAGAGPDVHVGGAGTLTAGFSLIEVAESAVDEAPAGTNRTGVDPQLGPLANNGGATQTHLPAATSPAIDAGVSNGITPDQRGVARPQDQPDVANAAGSDASDIGAVERAVVVEDTPDVLPNVPDPRCLGQQFAVKRGNEGDNVIPGTAAKDGIFAGPGDDAITGLEADDCLIGGTGRDKVEGDEGDDIVYGDPDNDKVKGGDGNDDARGQGGDDKVDGGEGDDSVRGGEGDDDLEGGPGKDFLKSNGGDDTLDPGPGRDRLRASGGADVINTADGSKDRVDCGTGKDVATVDPLDFVDENCNEVRTVR